MEKNLKGEVSHSDTSAERNDHRWMWLAGLLIFFGVIILLSTMDNGKNTDALRPDGLPKSLNYKIDRHLKDVDLKSQYHRARSVQETDEFLEESGSYSSKLGPGESPENLNQPLKVTPEQLEKNIAEEQAEKDRPWDYRVLTLDQKIQRGLAREQWLKDYDEKYRQEYVRAFIENARKAGYYVRLNDKLEVIEMTPIAVDDPIRFPNSVSGDSATNK